ncbi:MAG TPA: 1-(5-phosphoribosyl)-5-[(5-phosphoribosylamino)methylideneamino]imidazole-4-carboxamide isomerase, partial [Caldithrix sp.]|nr:1-(5-phosphoribosyl)-5-[(5-phosphoribosylamino)methylideneamino]imidazole-4-carboxamide isomerase [Caldithrix sp.]
MITIIPAIDVIDGKCVRLTKGNYDTKKIYNDDPLEVAREFEKAGIKRLHLVDLDGAKQQHIVNSATLDRVARGTNLQIDFGGGLKSDEDLQIAFSCGAQQITAGSIAVKNKSMVIQWLDKYGGDKIILGADVNNEKIAVSGWQEKTEIDLFEFLKEYIRYGIRTIICTDIAKDGMLTGPSFDLYKKIKDQFPELEIIASGGISQIDDVNKLNEMEIDG